MQEPQDRRVVLDLDAQAERIDRALARALPDVSRSRLQDLIRTGQVSKDGIVVLDLSLKVGAGAVLDVTIPAPVDATPVAETLDLVIVHEDDDLIVIDKPAGLVVHPAPGHDAGTLVNGLIAHCGESLSGIGGVRRPGIVHRLDKDTSGLLVVAKNDLAHKGLTAQFADHGRNGPLERAYLALTWGAPEPRLGTIDVELGRSQRNREKIAIMRPGEGRTAITHYVVEEILDAGTEVALVRCRLETGRTHQIRVHLSHRGHPLLGDAVYGNAFKTKAARLGASARASLEALGRQALHAAILGFEHPRTGEVLRFESPIPPDMAALISALRANDRS
ncbi:RluA family pseudouridine synthase [Methylobacterium bullatum]|uniref:Pseudouridine synthase n=1 Tax=Methylobacterium bullatum TaxID=570505 RepID=A0A679JT57_9HYPH|nr:RluA family pseudouridine synthase [Methylobacterium bullatum]MBD8900830.1 RNA pseudouridine synthase [Methylobacterium bullatum]GJD40997.1 Ribosomal large subunit pseudouridine synthase D [Methylobacterium bullatum]CAA2143621.1 Ribosomal large subunit pseudouridine synthase D [Methylobacterium bullatum]